MDVSLLASLLLSTLTICTPVNAAAGDIRRVPARPCFHSNENGDSIYNYNLTDINEEENISLSKYQDLVVLGIPSNQFGLQEPGSNASEILNGIKYVRPGNNFIPNFQMFKKSNINGADELPLYTYLKSRCPSTRDGFENIEAMYYAPIKHSDVKWNWEKFLINKKGTPYMRYDPSTDPENLKADIEYLLQEN